jgi:hypothetical protein
MLDRVDPFAVPAAVGDRTRGDRDPSGMLDVEVARDVGELVLPARFDGGTFIHRFVEHTFDTDDNTPA